jgi:hypothetical protein
MVSSENNDGGFTKYSRQRVDDKKMSDYWTEQNRKA